MDLIKLKAELIWPMDKIIAFATLNGWTPTVTVTDPPTAESIGGPTQVDNPVSAIDFSAALFKECAIDFFTTPLRKEAQRQAALGVEQTVATLAQSIEQSLIINSENI